MKIDVFVICRNEVKIAPFFIDYWKSLADDVNVYVYDGLSDDGTREFLSQFDFIHILDKEKSLNDDTHTHIKNNAWKSSDADFVMVCDFDETIFSYNIKTLHSELQRMKNEGFTILAPLSFNVVGDEFPDYQEGKFLHELEEFGFNDYIWETKPILFDPKQIKEMNYVHGAHAAHPSGNIKWFNSDKLFLIHCKFLSLEYYKNKIEKRQVSKWNTEHGILAESDRTESGLLKEYYDRKSLRFSWFDIKNNFDTYYKKKIDHSLWKGIVL